MELLLQFVGLDRLVWRFVGTRGTATGVGVGGGVGCLFRFGLTESVLVVDGVFQFADANLALDEFVRQTLDGGFELLDTVFQFLDAVTTHMTDSDVPPT